MQMHNRHATGGHAITRLLWLCCLLSGIWLTSAWADALDTMNPGEWYAVPSSQVNSVAASPSPGGNFVGIIEDWTGGAMDTARNELVDRKSVV